jgi:hypothetical protein
MAAKADVILITAGAIVHQGSPSDKTIPEQF